LPQAALLWALELRLCDQPLSSRPGGPLLFAAGCTDNPAAHRLKAGPVNDVRQADQAQAGIG